MTPADDDDRGELGNTGGEPKVNVLFRTALKHGGSHLYLKVGLPPMVRLNGLVRKMDAPPITLEQMAQLLHAILSPDLRNITRKCRNRFCSNETRRSRVRRGRSHMLHIYQQKHLEIVSMHASIRYLFIKCLIDFHRHLGSRALASRHRARQLTIRISN